MTESEQVLAGGVGNAGLTVRVGETVRRPWHTSTAATHALLRHLDDVLPGVGPVPVHEFEYQGTPSRDAQGREVLSWVDGEVAIPPFPAWVAQEEFLVSVGRLLRRVHDALEGWTAPPGAIWSSEMADPEGGSLITHTDVCPDNVVTRGGRAVAVVDWEFAAPGRRIWDVVSAARLCVPFVAPERRAPVYAGLDVVPRLHRFLDAYGLDDADRSLFIAVLEQRRQVGQAFVQRRIARGEPAFVGKWDNPAGRARLEVEQHWIAALPSDVARSDR